VSDDSLLEWSESDAAKNSAGCHAVAIAALRERLEASRVVIGDCTLYCEDCQFILPTLGRVDAVVTDPPYGMKWNTDSTRFSGGKFGHRTRRDGGRNDWGTVTGDDAPFDPEPWLNFKNVILFGANHFGSKLPVGSTLVWIKKLDSAFGSFLSDAEIAWKKGGHGVYCHRDMSMNHATGTTRRFHPTQKPVGVMKWCIGHLPVDAQIILDPFMGSGTTGVACVQMGRKFIGIERERRYFDAACRRIEEAYAQPRLDLPEPPRRDVAADQKSLFEADQ
jgi:DNA modification methylase